MTTARRRLGLALAAVAAPFSAAAALAQVRLDVLPSLTLSHAYDDNLFVSPAAPQADNVTQAAPQLEALLRSRYLETRLSYLQAGEMYDEREAFDALDARREGIVAVKWDAGRRLRLDVRGAYRSTRTPSDLVPASGLDLGRMPARQLQSEESLDLALGRRVGVLVRHTFAYDEVEGGVSGRTQDLGLTFRRLHRPRSTFTAGYVWRRFVSGGDETMFHILRLGWAGTVGRRTQLRIEAGPRLADGTLDSSPDGEASLRHTFSRGEISAAYARVIGRVVGVTGVARTESGTVGVAHDLPLRLRLSTAAGYYRTRAITDSRIWRADSELSWSPNQHVRLAVGHEAALTRDDVLGDATHNVYSARVVFRSVARPYGRRSGPESGTGLGIVGRTDTEEEREEAEEEEAQP